MLKLPDRLPPTVVGLLIVLTFACGNFTGYWLCKNQARVSAAAVVLEDVLVSVGIRDRHAIRQTRIEDLKNAPEMQMLDECFTRELPFNFDTE